MIKRILVANRGEIAVRVMRSCREMEITSIAIFSEADRTAKHVLYADEAYCVGPSASKESYLNIEKIIEVAKANHADAIHPGYGFLSENAAFARRCQEEGIIFIGPNPETMEAMGYKSTYAILDASKYGIPQARERLYVVSLLSGNEFEFPDEIPLKFHLRDFLDKTVNPADYQLSDAEKQLFFTNNGKLYVKEATKIGYKLVEDGDCINVAFPNSKTRRGRVGKGVAKTLTTAPRQAVYVNGCLRMLTAKECWRLMGFKDRDYAAMKRVGLTEAQICHLAGNSICVPVLQQIFTLITMGEIEQ